MDLKKYFIDVDLVGIHKTRLLWKNNDEEIFSPKDEEKFLANYSFITVNGLIEDKERLTDTKKTGSAERYGGKFIGCNGGGARVVNLNGLQVKGVGPNALAGEGAPHSHSYGGLDAQAAFKEIFYSLLINYISPVGAVDVHGLILVDKHSATYKDHPTWATLLVRETCERPAHYLRAGNFQIKAENINQVGRDEVRVKNIYRDTIRNFGYSKFLIKLHNFLDGSANQLSFCRAARFSHSLLSESNMSMDGKLLDTSVCGFVHAGNNFCQLTDFFSEPYAPFGAVEEIAYLLDKYTGHKIKVAQLKTYYNERFEQYFNINISFVFGFDRVKILTVCHTKYWKAIAMMINSIILSGTGEKSYALPDINYRDQLNELLSICLYKIIHEDNEFNDAALQLDEICNTFKYMLEDVHAVYRDDFNSINQFEIAVAIQTLKRAYLSSFFYLTYVSKAAEDLVASSITTNFQKLLDETEATIKWIYEDIDSTSILFKSARCSIVFFHSEDMIKVYQDSDLVFETNDRGDFLRFIKSTDINFKIIHYNFRPFLIRLAAFFYGASESTFKGIENAF